MAAGSACIMWGALHPKAPQAQAVSPPAVDYTTLMERTKNSACVLCFQAGKKYILYFLFLLDFINSYIDRLCTTCFVWFYASGLLAYLSSPVLSICPLIAVSLTKSFTFPYWIESTHTCCPSIALNMPPRAPRCPLGQIQTSKGRPCHKSVASGLPESIPAVWVPVLLLSPQTRAQQEKDDTERPQYLHVLHFHLAGWPEKELGTASTWTGLHARF